MKNTSKLENTVCELKNCSKCKALDACKNEIQGHVYYPTKVNDNIEFIYKPCKFYKRKKKKNNTIFFDSKKRGHWTWTQSFITALEGIALFPAVMLEVYFTPSIQNVAFYFVSIVILAKILTLYKCWSIFFRQKSIFLQIILYLCALEIVPMLALWGTLVMITNELKVIF